MEKNLPATFELINHLKTSIAIKTFFEIQETTIFFQTSLKKIPTSGETITNIVPTQKKVEIGDAKKGTM